MSEGLLADKTGLVMGVANQRSLAWSIVVAAARQGARVAVTYLDERLRRRVDRLAGEVELAGAYRCDVADDDAVRETFDDITRDLGGLDFLVHSIAFAKKEELEGGFVDTSRDGFSLAHDVSVYSLVAATRAVRPLMAGRPGGGSVLTLTFQGSERVFPGYNVMGVAKSSLEGTVRYLAHDLGSESIRVNAVSAGPIKTLASSAVPGVSRMREVMAEKAPLRRNVDAPEVADAAVFLLSDMARGVTGEVLHVDAGYHVMGY